MGKEVLPEVQPKRKYTKRSADAIFMAKVHGLKKAIKRYAKVQRQADKLKSSIKKAKARLLKGI